MTVLFTDVHKEIDAKIAAGKIDLVDYTELLYADDTLIFGTHTPSVNKLLKQVQIESAYYNMKLNFDKCINLLLNIVVMHVRIIHNWVISAKSIIKK